MAWGEAWKHSDHLGPRWLPVYNRGFHKVFVLFSSGVAVCLPELVLPDTVLSDIGDIKCNKAGMCRLCVLPFIEPAGGV